MSAAALTVAFVKTESWIGQVVGGLIDWLFDRSDDRLIVIDRLYDCSGE